MESQIKPLTNDEANILLSIIPQGYWEMFIEGFNKVFDKDFLGSDYLDVCRFLRMFVDVITAGDLTYLSDFDFSVASDFDFDPGEDQSYFYIYFNFFTKSGPSGEYGFEIKRINGNLELNYDDDCTYYDVKFGSGDVAFANMQEYVNKTFRGTKGRLR